ncbi:hypothetical protein HPP92_014853 [Vanilla planifolia]|uniref:Gelsolin-like domain-containing protein n=1 Tax=Vanilla planifolia TaxID=51239 RepID=A0A835QWP0_VANPL|nr:hypothetical protein HPP92_014853 [Vanilla planifolia]
MKRLNSAGWSYRKIFRSLCTSRTDLQAYKQLFLTEDLKLLSLSHILQLASNCNNPSLYIEGRGKVAAIFKHQGYDVKEIPEDDCRPIIDINGTLRVWRVNGHDVTPIAAVEQTVLYSGECYIIKVKPTSMQAIQVDPVSGSLNSSYCYILQDQVSSFTWLGSLSSPMDHELVDRLLDQISPLKQFISVREGSEPDVFWNMIGGKGDYPKQKVIKQHDEDPHLFTCVFEEGDFKGKEIFNYAQDDLTTEDIILLDCHYEIYIWVGQHAKLASEEQAFSLGKKFLETDILLEGLSDDAAIYVIPEGNEPPFFTSHFAWDNSKLNIHGNSFERKLAILKGSTQITESANRGTQKAHRGYVSEGLSDYSWRTSATSDGLHAQKGLLQQWLFLIQKLWTIVFS